MPIFEAVAMVAALTIMFAVVGAKILTTQLLNRTQNSIAAVNQNRQQALGELRMAQSQRKVAQQTMALLGKKRSKLQKKIGRLRQELGGMRDEAEHRQKMRDTVRGKLVRPALAVPQTSEQEGSTEEGPVDEA